MHLGTCLPIGKNHAWLLDPASVEYTNCSAHTVKDQALPRNVQTVPVIEKREHAVVTVEEAGS